MEAIELEQDEISCNQICGQESQYGDGDNKEI